MLRPIFTAFLLFFLYSAHTQAINAINLKCEYKVNPMGVEVATPKLSWELQSNKRNTSQSAYRIIVSEDQGSISKNIGTIWDSKKVNSQESIQVSFGGKKLAATRTYYWKVMVWDHTNA